MPRIATLVGGLVGLDSMEKLTTTCSASSTSVECRAVMHSESLYWRTVTASQSLGQGQRHCLQDSWATCSKKFCNDLSPILSGLPVSYLSRRKDRIQVFSSCPG